MKYHQKLDKFFCDLGFIKAWNSLEDRIGVGLWGLSECQLFLKS